MVRLDEIEVTFQLHTILQMQTPQGRITALRHRMRRGETIAGALKKLGLQIDPDETLIVIKGQNVGLEFQPNEGDIIHLIPAIAGG